MAKRTKEQISYNMSRIRSRDTSIEKAFRKALRKSGIRFAGNPKGVFGHPDFVLRNKKIAIFCDSAFWHGYRFGKTSVHNFKKRKKFWEQKILNNIERDKKVCRRLRAEGWRVLRFWDFKMKKNMEGCLAKVEACF